MMVVQKTGGGGGVKQAVVVKKGGGKCGRLHHTLLALSYCVYTAGFIIIYVCNRLIIVSKKIVNSEQKQQKHK